MSSLVYTLESKDTSLPKFTFDQSDGKLHVQDFVSLYLDDANVDSTKEQASYDVTLKVTDSMTPDDSSNKASSEVEAKVCISSSLLYDLDLIVSCSLPHPRPYCECGDYHCRM